MEQVRISHRRDVRALLIALFAFLLLLALLWLSSAGAAERRLVQAVVDRVVDGDTVVVILDGKQERVRMIGVDTPETVKPNTPPQPYGKEASDHTKRELTGKTVWLEFDASPTDRYQRWLAYIWLAEPRSRSDAEIQEKMYNARLLLDGYGQLMTI
jgi:Micrococcal nuclease (thermonuclease) homologs